MATIPVGLQLYTVRDEAAKDFAGAMRRVAALGYAGVELAGTGGLSAAAMKDLLAETGLALVGSHVPVTLFTSAPRGDMIHPWPSTPSCSTRWCATRMAA